MYNSVSHFARRPGVEIYRMGEEKKARKDVYIGKNNLRGLHHCMVLE